MSSYIVLARKWRPQTFSDLVGQQHIAVTLRNAIAQNRVAHAFLFTGSRGVGKTSTARIFAKALNCAHAPCDEPCNACESCREITEGHSMDVIEIDGASNRGINEIREVLDAVRYAPGRDRYKIYIIDEVHMLTTEAFNALLKTLEEPPAHVVFIFATTDPNKIPITIVSRCQRYDFKRIGTDDLVAHLGRIAESEGIAFDDSALRLIARNARGGVRDALSAMDQIIAFSEQPISGERAAEVLGVASRETLMRMGECVARRDVDGALACIEKVDHYGQNLSQFAFDLLEFWRDVTVMAASPNSPVELNATEKAQVWEWLNLAGFDRLQRIFQIWYQASEQLPKSLSPKLVMEMAAIRMCQVETVIPIEGILRRIDAITKGLNGGAVAPDALSHVQEYLMSKGLSPEGEKKKSDDVSDAESESFLNYVSKRTGMASPSGRGVALRPVQSDAESRTMVEAAASKPEKPVAESSVAGAQVSVELGCVREGSSADVVLAAEKRVGMGPKPLGSEGGFEDVVWEEDSGRSMTLEEVESMGSGWNEYEEEEEGEEGEGGEESRGEVKDGRDKKILEVSAERPKTLRLSGGSENSELSTMQRWKHLISQLHEPLSTILSRGRVDSFARGSVQVTLPTVYRMLITNRHEEEVDRLLFREVAPGCRLLVRYDEIGDESETLAAQEAQAQLAAQEKEYERVRHHPLMQKALEVFHIEPEGIRFTINEDRTGT